MVTYDAVPYPSKPYTQSAPGKIGAIAQLFGMKPADSANARVLEIGCASGGNILPLAVRFPKSKFIGVDISENQINEGKRNVEVLNLKNIIFYAKSILDFDYKKRKFDYIILHGLYSWVNAEVRNKILEICKKCLSKNGVAYISYNTLPGWNSLKTIRDMMLYHTENFSIFDEKVSEARNILQFVYTGLKDNKGPYKLVLEKMLNTLKEVNNDSYIFHEFLEEVNAPCYFYQFMEQAEKQELTYLGDTDLPTMFLANQSSEHVKNTLAKINDIVRLE